jgi:hypothetical protein
LTAVEDLGERLQHLAEVARAAAVSWRIGEVNRKTSSAPGARATGRIERLPLVRDAAAGDVATGVANAAPITVPRSLARVNFEVPGAWWVK